MDQHHALIQAILDQQVLGVAASQIEKIETHISTVLLTGDHAYKFKKPVNFGFLDFSTLEARKHFCEEEIRLNQRLAPSLYLETVAITGSPQAPQLDGEGQAIEYAVKMRQFDQSQLLDNLVKQNKLSDDIIDTIADKAAAFHAEAARAPADSPLGQPDALLAPMLQNFEQLRDLIDDAGKLAQLDTLENWTRTSFDALKPLLQTRVAQGFIRECHGDMHLGNITLVDGEVTIFDGIEFNDEFRWIDVMSEMAFITMDLIDRKRPEQAQQLINRYLETTGDYQGLPLLRFYQVYRAMVRAKIASFRLADPSLSDTERQETLAQYQSYADLANALMQAPRAQLVLSHGVSGSGKSTLSAQLLKRLPAIRIRSDVERKRLFAAQAKGAENIGEGIYSADASAKTYAELLRLSRHLLENGLSVIVDATFLQKAHRAPFQALAQELGLPFHVIWSDCDADTLRQRVAQRKGDVSDATVDVLEHQLKEVEAPQNSENPVVTPCADIDMDKVLTALKTA